MEELLKQILNKLQNIEDRMGNLATRQEVEETKESLIEEMKRVADTLETIAVGEAAATKEKLEDKVEAGDVILKSLIDGLENRASKRFDVLESRFDGLENRINGLEDQMTQGFKQVLLGIEKIANTQQGTAEILSAFIDKFQKQDELMDLFDERLKEQERQTLAIRRKLKELGGDLDAS